MIDFDFVSPTKIFFGRAKEAKIGDILSEFGAKKVLIVYGSKRIEADLLPFVLSKIEEKGIPYLIHSGVRPNPTLDFVHKGVEIVKENGIDFLLAIGGGSPIDVAKCIAAGACYDGDPFDFNLKKATPKKSLPVGVILTHASAGSELSNSAVIQDDARQIKAGFNSDWNRPVFAIENPELTFGVSAYQTAAGGSDIMMHSLERYFDPSDDDQLADEWALALVKNTMHAIKAALANPEDYEARARLMLNSSLSHNGLTGIGKQFSFVVHPIEHALSGYAPSVTHGAGVALIFPAWAEYVVDRDVAKFARMAEALFDIKGDNLKKTAIIGITSMRQFFASIGMPTRLADVGLGEKDIPSLAALATGNNTRMIGCCHQSLNMGDVEAILAKLL